MRRDTLLWVGLLGGIALVLAGLRRAPPDDTTIPPDAAAVVDGVPIPMARYRERVRLVSPDGKGTGLDAAQRRQVLDALIDEELMVARALELGLGRDDVLARKRLVAALWELIASEGDRAPTEADLRALYAAQATRQARPTLLRVEVIFARERATIDAAWARVRAGEPFAQVRDALSDPTPSPPPKGPLPASALRDLVGPTAAAAAAALQPGAVTAPIRAAGGYRIIRLVERSVGPPPGFETLRASLAAQWKRQTRAHAIRRYVDALRSSARIGAPGVPP